jgi:hypothetical protein
MIYKVNKIFIKKKIFDFYFINSILLYYVIIVIQQIEAEKQTIQNQNELDSTTERTESLEQENNTSFILDPVLLDITNQQITHHELLRNMARQDLQCYTEKMVNQMNKSKKRIKEYQIGDLVRIAVPKIDRCSVDRPTLPCKIIERTENDKYGIGSKFGIIEVYYTANELEPLGAASFPELDNIPSNKISIREASRLQSAGSMSGSICNCKGECNSNKCRCKKIGGSCNSRCHSGRSCQNK